MPIQDQALNRFVEAQLIKTNEEREAEHESSGKLSASMLYQPLRFQVLKTIGVPRKPFDAYTLGKFRRGRRVENDHIEEIRKAGFLVEDEATLSTYSLKIEDDRQAFAEYREAIGYVDSVIDTNKMDSKVGIIPNEIKSVTNMKLKRIKSTGIDWHYKIQACMYALAMGVDHYAVTVVSAEDDRFETYVFDTRDLKKDVDQAISNYMIAMENWKKDRTLPAFEPHPMVKWTANLKYAMFEEEWATLPDSMVIKKIEELKLV